ncbi:MAG: 7-cyano-7-deazaguanine synthase [Candidatus Methanomethylophilaceae archaeon]|nr:7-cyano-7-deazaguanine synthase [Candidatus Methanomethylophilaceae archaeon]
MKLVSLISGGIDSPVASYMMAHVGADVTMLHMDNGQFGDPKDVEKVVSIAKQLEKVTGKEFPVFVANHEPNQAAIKKSCDANYQCVMCKRFMHHVAKRFAIQNGFDGIIMGDSLGQVASQTLRNIKAEQTELAFPIIRPLIGLDKIEIIDTAKRIGTYDISIIQTKGCAAVPMKPVTEATPEKVKELQARLDFEGLVSASADNARRVH